METTAQKYANWDRSAAFTLGNLLRRKIREASGNHHINPEDGPVTITLDELDLFDIKEILEINSSI